MRFHDLDDSLRLNMYSFKALEAVYLTHGYACSPLGLV